MKRGFATAIVARTETALDKIIGYYTLPAASVLLDNVPEKIARKMPRYPNIPAVRLGRLTVASSMQGQHVGSLMVLDALRRSCANELAWTLFLEHVSAFYEKFLFQRFSDNTLHLWMHRKQAKALCTWEDKTKWYIKTQIQIIYFILYNMPFLHFHLDDLYRNGKIFELISRRVVTSVAWVAWMTVVAWMAVMGSHKHFVRCFVHDIGKIGIVLFHRVLPNLGIRRLLDWLFNSFQRKHAHCHEQ